MGSASMDSKFEHEADGIDEFFKFFFFSFPFSAVFTDSTEAVDARDFIILSHVCLSRNEGGAPVEDLIAY